MGWNKRPGPYSKIESGKLFNSWFFYNIVHTRIVNGTLQIVRIWQCTCSRDGWQATSGSAFCRMLFHQLKVQFQMLFHKMKVQFQMLSVGGAVTNVTTILIGGLIIERLWQYKWQAGSSAKNVIASVEGGTSQYKWKRTLPSSQLPPSIRTYNK